MSAAVLPPNATGVNTRFVPSDEQRQLVAAMASGAISQEVIAKFIVHPATKKPINKKTLVRAFAGELKDGREIMDGVCLSGIGRAMAAGEPWALAMYAKCKLRWSSTHPPRMDDPEDMLPMPPSTPPLAPGSPAIIDVTPEAIPDDPVRAAQEYQRIVGR